MTREEAIEAIKANYPSGGYHKLCEALDIAIKTLEDFEALNAINLDLADENEDLVERIGKLIGYIDFLRNVGTGKKKSLDYLEKVVKGQIKEIRAEGENFVKPRTGEWIPVTERLPENAKHKGAFCPKYYVMTEYGVTEGWYNPDVKCWYALLWFMDGRFEEWNINIDKGDIPMPLPQPYKAESEG